MCLCVRTFVRVWGATDAAAQLSPKSPVLLVGTKVDSKGERLDRKVPEQLVQDLLMVVNYLEIGASRARQRGEAL